MSDLKKLADDATARAVVEVGKQAAKRALDDFLPPDDEKGKGGDKDGEPKENTSRKWWIIAGVVLAACAVIGVVGLVMAYWQWFLLAGIVGLGGLYGYYRLRQRSREKKKPVEETSEEAEAKPAPAKARVKAEPEKKESDEEAAALAAEHRREAIEERRRQLEAEREARAEREREVDDELAAMKERIKRES